MNEFLMAFGLVLILEGLLPFLMPGFWRRVMQQALMQNDKSLRVCGFISMLIGLGLLYWFH